RGEERRRIGRRLRRRDLPEVCGGGRPPERFPFAWGGGAGERRPNPPPWPPGPKTSGGPSGAPGGEAAIPARRTRPAKTAKPTVTAASARRVFVSSRLATTP